MTGQNSEQFLRTSIYQQVLKQVEIDGKRLLDFHVKYAGDEAFTYVQIDEEKCWEIHFLKIDTLDYQLAEDFDEKTVVGKALQVEDSEHYDCSHITIEGTGITISCHCKEMLLRERAIAEMAQAYKLPIGE